MCGAGEKEESRSEAAGTAQAKQNRRLRTRGIPLALEPPAPVSRLVAASSAPSSHQFLDDQGQVRKVLVACRLDCESKCCGAGPGRGQDAYLPAALSSISSAVHAGECCLGECNAPDARVRGAGERLVRLAGVQTHASKRHRGVLRSRSKSDRR